MNSNARTNGILSILRGVGVNADAGIAGSIVIDERNWEDQHEQWNRRWFGNLMMQMGVNSDSGLTDSIVVNEDPSGEPEIGNRKWLKKVKGIQVISTWDHGILVPETGEIIPVGWAKPGPKKIERIGIEFP